MKCLWHISLLIWLFRCSMIITPPLLPLYAASGGLVQNSRSPSHWFAAKWSGSFLLYRTYHDSDPNINTLNFIFTILWFIWKTRNNLRFREKKVAILWRWFTRPMQCCNNYTRSHHSTHKVCKFQTPCRFRQTTPVRSRRPTRLLQILHDAQGSFHFPPINTHRPQVRIIQCRSKQRCPSNHRRTGNNSSIWASPKPLHDWWQKPT